MNSLAEFIDAVAQEVWSLAIDYWFTAFTNWLDTLFSGPCHTGLQ